MMDTNLEPQPPVGNVMVVYLGPVAPHWDVRSTFGDRMLVQSFRDRINQDGRVGCTYDPTRQP